jgi:hypothetical protein
VGIFHSAVDRQTLPVLNLLINVESYLVRPKSIPSFSLGNSIAPVISLTGKWGNASGESLSDYAPVSFGAAQPTLVSVKRARKTFTTNGNG